MKAVADNVEKILEDDTFINDVKLKKHELDIFSLVRNDNVMVCHDKLPACNSNCPLFNMKKGTDDIIWVDICCGSMPVHYKITEIVPFKKTIEKSENK